VAFDAIETMRRQLAPHGIRVVTLATGGVVSCGALID
jgi:hypothetical protein